MSSQFLSSEFLYWQNEFIVTLAAFVLFLIAMGIGFRRGRAIGTAVAQATKSQVSTLEAGVMGLLGSADRFHLRDGGFTVRYPARADRGGSQRYPHRQPTLAAAPRTVSQ